jgi:hypothetical protein
LYVDSDLFLNNERLIVTPAAAANCSGSTRERERERERERIKDCETAVDYR